MRGDLKCPAEVVGTVGRQLATGSFNRGSLCSDRSHKGEESESELHGVVGGRGDGKSR